MEGNATEQEEISGHVRASAQARTRFLTSARFSEMGNRAGVLHPRKWAGESSKDTVFQNSKVEKTSLRPHFKGPVLFLEKRC